MLSTFMVTYIQIIADVRPLGIPQGITKTQPIQSTSDFFLIVCPFSSYTSIHVQVAMHPCPLRFFLFDRPKWRYMLEYEIYNVLCSCMYFMQTNDELFKINLKRNAFLLDQQFCKSVLTVIHFSKYKSKDVVGVFVFLIVISLFPLNSGLKNTWKSIILSKQFYIYSKCPIAFFFRKGVGA